MDRSEVKKLIRKMKEEDRLGNQTIASELNSLGVTRKNGKEVDAQYVSGLYFQMNKKSRKIEGSPQWLVKILKDPRIPEDEKNELVAKFTSGKDTTEVILEERAGRRSIGVYLNDAFGKRKKKLARVGCEEASYLMKNSKRIRELLRESKQKKIVDSEPQS